MMEQTGEKADIDWDAIKQDDDEWKKRRAVPLVELKSRGSHGSTVSSYYTLYDEGHTRTMASLVPDEIIYNIGDYSKRDFDGCLLFGDVSGFTDLCEKYNKSGKGGPSRLTQVLNSYIGAMVQEIMSHGGDVLEFSGDAFIALWKVTDHVSMRDAVHEAIDCSLVIQKTYGTYQTDVDVVVRVKLAVACGHIVFSLVGNQESSHYLMTGDPIFAIKEAEGKSSAGEIVITARVSRHTSANEYLLNVLPDGLHAKVLGVGPNWRNTQRQFDDKDAYGQPLRDLEEESAVSSVISEATTTLLDEEEGIIPVVTDQYALRPAVNHAARMKLKDDIKKFIITPVVRGIEASEPLEYLTEIRQVAILFINCKVSLAVNPIEGIDIAHNVYNTVHSIVKNRYGCVNKISNFDKDLMLLIIFGLRGFKHELENQIALKCARECFEKIKIIDKIEGIAVAVTTGSCYCGAFGHTLRREYTVIGLVVNKAARLMMAYPQKVTCDRETFLYSKLEARNFILQEYKPLKGIVTPGPIYEFKEIERSQDLGFSISPFPLLGRDEELNLYDSLMRRAKNLSQRTGVKVHFFNMLIIRGDFRQGKTRLLEEVLFASDPSIPIHTFTLTADDRNVPFRTIQLIFLQFIGIPGKTSRTSRERRLHIRLQDKKVEDSYYVFNEVFDVKFPRKNLSKEEEEKFLSKMFTSLSGRCFSKFWVIAIDDADYIDDQSWTLIQLLLDLRLIFVLVTMGTKRELTANALTAMKDQHIKIIELKPIEKWYHVGLVCQMLGIEGIPPELQKTVQIKSNGNPGWIENFLVTLMQSGGISVKEITRATAYSTGIVMPPPYMIVRLSQKLTELWMDNMEERILPAKDEEVLKRWKIFVGSCRESYPDITEEFENFKKEQTISVCLLNPDLNLDDVEPEQHMDVLILQTFDSLTSYEQLLLKCSSVLGDMFPRGMLLYIMSSTASRLIALAVQKLFEIQVLSCARGNFLDGGLNFTERLMDPNEDTSVKCDCIGLMIEESCIDLPKYASCGYMRFRSSEFRETTYNLLTDNQKREFHGKAIRYMEKETRRCRACGSGYFTRYLGAGRLDDGLRSKTKSKKYSLVSQDSGDTHIDKSSTAGSSTSGSKSIVGSIKAGRDTVMRSSASSTVENMSISAESFFSASGLGITTIKKLKGNFNLVKTFSSYDYSQCTCPLILNTMYSKLIEHSKGAGLVEKIMEATIEYSYVCIENKNAPQAIKVLEEALQLLEGPMKDQIELEWMIALKRGKLFTLIGRARMYLHDDEAYYFLIQALQFYGITFPTTSIGKSLLKSHLKLKQVIRLYLFSHILNRKIDEDLSEYCNNVSECLHLLCHYFINKCRWGEAELAAVWSLTKALQTESDFEVICLAYATMIYVTSVTKQPRLSVALEVFALRTCHRKRTIVELDELKAVTSLYFHIGRCRLMRGDIDKAMQMSFVIWRIANAARCQELLFNFFPLIAYGMMLRKQAVEYNNVLNELWYIAEQDIDNSEKVWYYALCLTLQLEMGFLVQPIEKCNRFAQGTVFEDNLRDPMGKSRLIVCNWLWEIRNDNWEAATIWQKEAWSYSILKKGEKFNHLVTGLYLIEGLIIFMVNKMDTKNFRVTSKVDNFICALFTRLEECCRYSVVLLPRLYHLKGYYTIVKYNDYKSAMKYLKKGKKIADKQHNDLEVSWIEHTELAWTNKLAPEEKFAWQERCEEGSCIQFTDVDFLGKAAQYSLPLPIYV